VGKGIVKINYTLIKGENQKVSPTGGDLEGANKE
jgi:hypothetical protein